MEEMGLSDNVLTYTTSDFGHTVSNNGRVRIMVGFSSIDHGWGLKSGVIGNYQV